jgi:hypothetical protein
MECPKCGRKCFEGVVKSEQAGRLFSEGTMLTWTPEYEKKSVIKKDKLNLKKQVQVITASFVKRFMRPLN